MTYVPRLQRSVDGGSLGRGRLDLCLRNVSNAVADAGDLLPLGVTVVELTELALDWTPLAETVPSCDSAVTFIVMAAAGTPEPIIDRLIEAIVAYLATPEAKEAFLKAGSEPVGSTPEELGHFMQRDMERLGKVIEDAGLRSN